MSEVNRQKPRSRVALFSLVIVGILALFIEAASFLMCIFILKPIGLVYEPYDTSDYDAAYLEKRDPVVGWPSPAHFGDKGRNFSGNPGGSPTGSEKEQFDRKGTRVSPAFPNPDVQPCVSVYGDSFAWSEEVDPDHAWPNLLARSIGCRVDNFGVGGYGTDQAYLRYRENVTAGKESAPIVVITVYTENVMRNVNQLRYFLYATDVSRYGLKPRFVLGRSGQLKLVPMPMFSHAGFDRALRNPAVFLPYEFFLPGSNQGLVWLRFPYTRAAVAASWRLLFILRAKLAGLPLHYPFYEPGHPAHAVELTAAIVAQFRDDVLRNGHKPFAVIIPSGYELRYYHRHHIWLQQTLLDALAQRNISVINLGPEVISRISGSDPCSLYNGCGRHLSERGYALLAQVVQEHLAATLNELRQPKSREMAPTTIRSSEALSSQNY